VLRLLGSAYVRLVFDLDRFYICFTERYTSAEMHPQHFPGHVSVYGDCRRSEKVRVGTYGVQGDFSWSSGSVTSLPDAFEGLAGWGESCPNLYRRAVFIDWTDYQGNYGYEQVNY